MSEFLYTILTLRLLLFLFILLYIYLCFCLFVCIYLFYYFDFFLRMKPAKMSTANADVLTDCNYDDNVDADDDVR